MNFGNPGSKYVQLLQRTSQGLNNGTTTGGLAHALNQGLQGFIAGQEMRREQAARGRLAQALTGMLPTTAPAPAGGGPTALVPPGASGPGAAPGSAPAGPPAAPSAPASSGGYNDMLRELAYTDPNAALPLIMGERNRQLAAEAAERDRLQRLEDEKAMLTFRQGLAPQDTFETVQNPFGRGGVGQRNTRTGQITGYQGVDQPERYISVPSVGVFDTETNAYVGDGASAAPTAGLPEPTQDALANLPPAKRGDAQVRELTAANAELANMRESLKPALEIAKQADRFGQLLDVQDTGGFFRKIPGAAMVEGAYDPQIEEMTAIVNRITPMMRQGLPGAASDRDVAMFRGAAFGTDKRPQANRNIIRGFQTSAQLAQDRLAFLDEYVSQNGTLRGSDQVWQDYLNANPIFDPNGSIEEPTLNPGRRGWREYFYSAGRNSQPENGGWSIQKVN